ncbi:unnamed protein product [Phytomonas sp. EM1]|nr:unnamed protein product [Phytomonas sp. EM1]|eukprot:CCW62906.1 unnamed protein product [Phytomonas sp. isolate EM1]
MSIRLIATSCVDWSLNAEATSEDTFWWNNTFSITIFERALQVTKERYVDQITDTDVWEKYIEFQIKNVFKMCSVCSRPEGNTDMRICCNCGGTIHMECSLVATPDQIISKPANTRFKDLMCLCARCHGNTTGQGLSPQLKEADNLRRVAIRVLSLKEELPLTIYEEVSRIAQKANELSNPSQLMTRLKCLVRDLYQSQSSLSFLAKERISSKSSGIGVVATQNIPEFSIIGVYPGYIDMLSGEQAKYGRPFPKYALMELNCADFYNNVFEEFQDTFTPFINEPNENETSNCAWIQESNQINGRLSIISVKEIKKGEELLIGYGPIYARNYPYRYDAYAFHPVEGYDNPCCYALWHWPTLDKDNAEFVGYVGYLQHMNKYMNWESILKS